MLVLVSFPLLLFSLWCFHSLVLSSLASTIWATRELWGQATSRERNCSYSNMGSSWRTQWKDSRSDPKNPTLCVLTVKVHLCPPIYIKLTLLNNHQVTTMCAHYVDHDPFNQGLLCNFEFRFLKAISYEIFNYMVTPPIFTRVVHALPPHRVCPVLCSCNEAIWNEKCDVPWQHNLSHHRWSHTWRPVHLQDQSHQQEGTGTTKQGFQCCHARM